MFPITVTVHNATQLAAVLAAMQFPSAATEPTTEQMAGALSRRVQAQHAAVDDTAGIEEVNKAPAGKSSTARTAPTPPTAEAAKADAPAKSATAASATTPPADAIDAKPATDLTYDVVAKAITERAKTDRAHVIATLESFGVKKGTELQADQYADFMKALA